MLPPENGRKFYSYKNTDRKRVTNSWERIIFQHACTVKSMLRRMGIKHQSLVCDSKKFTSCLLCTYRLNILQEPEGGEQSRRRGDYLQAAHELTLIELMRKWTGLYIMSATFYT